MALHYLSVTLVVHPGWPIHHPLEAHDPAGRLVPAAAHTVALGDLPVLWPRAVTWNRVSGGADAGALESASLPPLRASLEVFWFLLEVERFIWSWGR